MSAQITDDVAAVDEITFGEISQRLRSRIKLIMVAALICGGAGTALAFCLKPVYRAEILMVPVTGDRSDSGSLSGLSSQFGGLASLAGISIGQNSDRKTEALATLNSRLLTEAFISDRNLLPILFARKWDASNSTWKVGSKKDIPTLWDGNKRFTEIRDIQEDKKSGLVTVAVEWTDPVLAKSWVTELVDRTNKLLRARAIERSENNIRYIQAQLDAAGVVEVRQALFRMIENEIKATMLAQSSGDYAFKVIDPAVIPEEKVRPQRGLIITLSILAGLLLGSLYALVKPAPN